MRTTADAVAKIIQVDASVTDISMFIETANNLVTRLLGTNADLDSAALELIERWLSAHFYAVFDPRVSSESVSGVSASYQHSVSLGLAVTTYGQQAMMLDTTGTLAAYNAKATGKTKGAVKPQLFWAGTDDTEGSTASAGTSGE